MYSCLFNSDNKPLLPGLFFTCYDGYMVTGTVDNPVNNVNFFANAVPIATSKTDTTKSIYGATSSISDISVGTNGCITTASTPDEFSVQWLGYFKPNSTTSWYFRTTSDDCSFLWIGENALKGFTTTNANVNNGGFHAEKTVESGALSLNANEYYALRIQFGEAGGGNVMKVEFSSNNKATWSSDGSGNYFHT